LRGYSELEAVPLVAPDVQTSIGFMYTNSDIPSNAMRATLELANDRAWVTHMSAFVGLLQPPKASVRSART
jgi:hypothetical protein